MLNVLHRRFGANPAGKQAQAHNEEKKAQMSTVSHRDWIKQPPTKRLSLYPSYTNTHTMSHPRINAQPNSKPELICVSQSTSGGTRMNVTHNILNIKVKAQKMFALSILMTFPFHFTSLSVRLSLSVTVD